MELRTLTPEQYDDIVGVWERAGLPYRPKGRDSRSAIERQMALDPDMWLGCFYEDELVGVLLGTYESRKGWLNRLAVLPEHRGKGFGKAMVLEMERRLRAKGLGIFAALIEDDHEASMKLFKDAGYEEHEGIHYLRKRDYPEV